MYFKNILGNQAIKNLLSKEIADNRIPHGQLFTGASGSGKLPMALAFSTYLFCKNKTNLDACGKCSSCIKMLKLTHPDLHFVYPTISPKTTSSKKLISESKKYFPAFQKAVLKNPYLSVQEWGKLLGGNNKRSGIRKSDILVMCKLARLRSYEGVYKVFIIWCAEKMNPEASSALLKSLEEPTSKTIFILISDHCHNLLTTIRSRVQTKNFKKIDADIILKTINANHPELDVELIKDYIIESDCNYSSVLNSVNSNLGADESCDEFIKWIRLCFLSANKKAKFVDPDTKEKIPVIPTLIDWCNNISDLERDLQIMFLIKASEIFREGFLLNYESVLTKRTNISKLDFNMANFSQHIKNHNICEIFSLLNNSYYCLHRYANSKILFLDLSLCLGKLLHKEKSYGVC